MILCGGAGSSLAALFPGCPGVPIFRRLVSSADIGTSFCAKSGAAARHVAIAPKITLLVIFKDISHLNASCRMGLRDALANLTPRRRPFHGHFGALSGVAGTIRNPPRQRQYSLIQRVASF